MEQNILKQIKYEFTLSSFAFLDSTYLIERYARKHGDFHAYCQKKWDSFHRSLGVTNILLIYSPIFIFLLILLTGVVFGELKDLIILPLLLFVVRIGTIIKHEIHNKINKFLNSNMFTNDAAFITIRGLNVPPVEMVEENNSFKDSSYRFVKLLLVIKNRFPNEYERLFTINMDKLNSFNLRDRLLILDVILHEKNSVSSIVSQASKQFNLDKNEFWNNFSVIFSNADVRNLRKFAETKNWYRNRTEDLKMHFRLKQIQNFLKEETDVSINIIDYVING